MLTLHALRYYVDIVPLMLTLSAGVCEAVTVRPGLDWVDGRHRHSPGRRELQVRPDCTLTLHS
jgi:hypothetical protein